MRRGSISLTLGVIVLAIVAAWTVHGIAPPEARGLDAAATEFSAARAIVHVEAISKTPHPVGTPAHEDVRAYILGVLAGLGIEARVEETRAALKAGGVTHAAHVKNVIARLPGTRPGPAVMLAAHYDSVAQSHGASDDGSGVATLLETARALVASPRMQNDVLFVFTDAEEVAGTGSFAFTRDELEETPIGVALNFEARGTRGAVALYDTSPDDGALIAGLARVAPRIVSTSLLGSLARALPNDSDATLWKRAGIPTFAFAYVDHEYQYHQSTDSLDALDPRSLQHDGDYALPLVRYFGDQRLPLPPTSAVTYFDVFGRGVVSYSTLVARALGVLTLAAYVALLLGSRRRAELALGGVAVAATACFGALVLAGLLAGLVHVGLRYAMTPFVLFAHPWLAAATGVPLGMAALFLVFGWRVRDGNVTHVVFGALTLWAFALALTTAFVPAASFIFQWPLAFALLGTWVWLPRRDEPSGRVDAAVTLALVPTTFFWSYLAYTLFVMVGGRAPEAMVVAIAMALLLAIPVLARVTSSDARRLGAVAAIASLLAGIFGALVIRAAPNVPWPDSLQYDLTAATHVATWSTNDPMHDAFVAQRVPMGRRKVRADVYDFVPLETHSSSVDEGALRHITLHVASPRRARCIDIWEITHEPIAKARIDDADVADVVRFSPETDEKIVRLFMGGRNPSSWVMEYCGADETGFKLELFSPRGRPVTLRLYEYSDGLPGPPLAPRTSADGYPAPDSDETVAGVDVKL
jgi:hypothetical protein